MCHLIPTKADKTSITPGVPASEANPEEISGKALYVNLSNSRSDYNGTKIATVLTIVYYDGHFENSTDGYPGYRWVFTLPDEINPLSDEPSTVTPFKPIDLSNGLRLTIKPDSTVGYIVNINGIDYYKGTDVTTFPTADINGYATPVLTADDYFNKTENYLNSMTYAKKDIDLSGLCDLGYGYITIGVTGIEDRNLVHGADISVNTINNVPAQEWDGTLYCEHEFTEEWKPGVPPTCISEGEKYKQCSLCAYIITESVPTTDHTPGEWVTVKAATVTEEGFKAKYCSICDIELETDTIPKLPKPPFDDVLHDAWYFEAVSYCAENTIVIGIGDNKFNPEGTLTREQFVVILSRVANAELDSVNKTSFTDVNIKSWYAPAVIWAAKEGYVIGIGESKFGVGVNINRESLAVLLLRYAEKTGKDVGRKADLTYYTDVTEISNWAKSACEWAVEAKILVSTSAEMKTFSPKMTVTRGQAAEIICNYNKNLK